MKRGCTAAAVRSPRWGVAATIKTFGVIVAETEAGAGADQGAVRRHGNLIRGSIPDVVTGRRLAPVY